ncbi:P-loop containing nucleoside triphosphate hydrolase protein [Ostreococcus tauri]|uniref:P-loop containing nucleoside triphosphate hydrolase protein n=1 Tax=Ostreococcus tauri TaxID=70448 RepID=A0A1Y5I9N7_OSTTA|nr:P-loop containing nucleoside triphosphate hydrolase protein [Ostreococcus tauri]
MGEEDDDTDGATATTGGGGRRSAYRRGDARPWELARWRREDEKNAARIDSTHRRSSYGDDGGLNDALDASATGFARVGIPAHLADAARSAGLRRTTEIQRLATPPLMEGKNVAILAETGSGKTFAYLLPTMAGRCCPACVVLVPSVELGRQVTHAAELAAFWCTMSDEAIKSGYYTPNAIPEFRNADVLVCTPARLLKLIKDEWVLLGRLRHVVVDEADEMLSSGFASDVGEIIKLSYGENGINRFDTKVQYIFAAATMREAQPLLETFPGEVEWVSTARFGRVHPQLDVRVDDVRGDDAKFESLCDALNRHKAYKTLIFANSPEDADELVGKLDARDVVALAFHGRAKERGVVLDDFIAGDLKVCVCTDLAARGIDFPDLHHVAQYGAAPSMEMFLHRCGRTARTGQRGPFHVTCVVDLDAETVDEDVRSELESHR